jgi:hypothetical protein
LSLLSSLKLFLFHLHSRWLSLLQTIQKAKTRVTELSLF